MYLDPSNEDQVNLVPTAIFPIAMGAWKFGKEHPYISRIMNKLPIFGSYILSYLGIREVGKVGYKLPDIELDLKSCRVW